MNLIKTLKNKVEQKTWKFNIEKVKFSDESKKLGKITKMVRSKKNNIFIMKYMMIPKIFTHSPYLYRKITT